MVFVLTFTLHAATTTDFTIEPTQLDSGSAAGDTYTFELWANGIAKGIYNYAPSTWNPTINTLYTITYAQLGYGGIGDFVPGVLFNVTIQDTTVPGAATTPSNAPDVSTQGTPIGSPPCFPRGTPILTKEGYRPVETLTNEDTVQTADGRDVSIKLLHFTVAKANQQTAPYRIQAGALGHYYPPEDLCLSAIHAIQDSRGVWQMPKYLARHNPLVQQYGLGESVEYFHIQCPNFFTDNLVVNGAIVESFKGRQGTHGVVYVWNKELNGFTRNEKEKIVAVPKNPHTAMVWG